MFACAHTQLLINARESIDQAILSMKLNVTGSLAQDGTTGLMSVKELPDDRNRKRFVAPQLPRMLNDRNASQVTTANGKSNYLAN